jgi:predicted transcriptional regulator
MKRATVKDVMSTPIISIKTNETVQDAINKLRSTCVNKAIIYDPQDEIIGYTDVWKLELTQQQNMKIEDILKSKDLMYTKILQVNQNTPLKNVMLELLEKDILVVINDKGDKIGVITSQDVRKVNEMEFNL